MILGKSIKQFFVLFFLFVTASLMAIAIFTIFMFFLAPIETGGAYARMGLVPRNKLASYEITDKVIAFCEKESDSKRELLECLKDFFSVFFEYNESLVFCSPDETIVYGGDCKCASAWYAYVLDKLGFKYWLETIPQHMYVGTMFNESGRQYICYLDQRYMICDRVG